VILAAPTIATRLQALDPDHADTNSAGPATQRKRGIVYRSIRRFGPGKVFAAFALIVGILVVAAYLLIHQI
jgi:hypothetical protein